MELIIKCNDQDIKDLFKHKDPDMDKIMADFLRENENWKLKDEIQDLKLENDRLKQRDELMLKFISDLYGELADKDTLIIRSELIRTMNNLRKQLEDL